MYLPPGTRYRGLKKVLTSHCAVGHLTSRSLTTRSGEGDFQAFDHITSALR